MTSKQNNNRIRHFDLNSVAFKRDPFPTLTKLIEEGPLVRSRLPIIGKCWFITHHAAVCEVLRDQQRFVRDPKNAGKKFLAGIQWWLPKGLNRLANNMLSFDGDKHRRLRSLVDQAFLRTNLELMQPWIAELANHLVDQVAEEIKTKGSVDLVTCFSRPLPLAVICELLGLPENDREQFTGWVSSMSEVRSVIGILRLFPGVRKLVRYLESQFEAVRDSPRPGLLNELVKARENGQRLTGDELLSMTFLLLMAGHETTVHLISGGVLHLLQHPEQRLQLMRDWALVPSTVNELLRYGTPVQISKPRMVAQSMEWNGRQLGRGELVVPILAAANADPVKFENPEVFDIHRANAGNHLSFGSGPHVCLGLKLAQLEAQIALQTLLTRIPDLELAVKESEIAWTRRLGMRALRSLPVRTGA